MTAMRQILPPKQTTAHGRARSLGLDHCAAASAAKRPSLLADCSLARDWRKGRVAAAQVFDKQPVNMRKLKGRFGKERLAAMRPKPT
ncbi:hypothetical protein D9M68_831020 [compost metagenome]